MKAAGRQLLQRHAGRLRRQRAASPFNSDTPRIYKGVNIQFDAILTKTGYHYASNASSRCGRRRAGDREEAAAGGRW